MEKIPTGICEGCHKPFPKTRKDKRTCNNLCANKAWNKRGRKARRK